MGNRSRFLSMLLTGGVVLSGGAAVLAASGGSSSSGSASSAQYCTGSSSGQQTGDCNGGGDTGGGGNAGGEGEGKKHKKKTRHRVRYSPRHGCASRQFTLRVTVVNLPTGRKSRVFLDGKRVRTTGRRIFTVRLNAGRLRSGMHRVTIKTRGVDGKTVVRKVLFRRC